MTTTQIKQFLADEEDFAKGLGIDFSVTQYGRTWNVRVGATAITCVPTSAVPYVAHGMLNVAGHNKETL